MNITNFTHVYPTIPKKRMRFNHSILINRYCALCCINLVICRFNVLMIIRRWIFATVFGHLFWNRVIQTWFYYFSHWRGVFSYWEFTYLWLTWQAEWIYFNPTIYEALIYASAVGFKRDDFQRHVFIACQLKSIHQTSPYFKNSLVTCSSALCVSESKQFNFE